MKALKYTVIVIILITIFYSCERIFEDGTTQVYGKITDIETDEPLSHVKIYLYEGASDFFSGSGYWVADSVFTDGNGEYELEFFHNDKYGYSIRPIAPHYVYYKERNGLLIGGGESLRF